MSKAVSKEISFSEILKPYSSKWWWFLLSVFIILVIGILYVKSVAPVYKSQTSVLIKDAKKMSAASGDIGVLQSIGGLSGMGTNSIENEIGIFASKTIIEDVVKLYRFQTSIYSKQTFYNLELYGKTSPYIINVIQENNEEVLPKKPIFIKTNGNSITLSSKEWKKDIVTSFDKTIKLPYAMLMISKNPKYQKIPSITMNEISFTYNNFENTVDDFQNELQVDLLDKEGTIINLSVDFKNKDKAKDFLNSLVQQYNSYAINDKNIESQKTKDFIDKRIFLISKELGDVELKKQDFKSANNIVDLATEAKFNVQMKEQSSAQSLEIGTQLELIKILQGSLNKKGPGDVLPLNIGLDNESAVKSIQEYNALVLQRNKYLEEATPENILVKNANRQIEEMKSSLYQSLQKNVIALGLAKNKVDGQLGASENMISKIPAKENMFRSIERQQQIKENLYLLLLQKREEAAISMEMTSEKARVIDHAFTFKKPVAPKKLIILLVLTIIGLFIPFMFIYIRKILQTTISNRSDISKLTDTPVIAELPKFKNSKEFVVSFNDVSPMAESFRILVTNLKFLLPKKDVSNVIMVTSSVKGEGKTFVSTNLSIVLASVREKVLIIGADIRNPQLQRYSPENRLSIGLTEYMSGNDITLQELIHKSDFNEHCDVIYSGAIPPNPTELLQNGKFEELLELIKSENKYKYIVLDTAPLLLVTDSLLISSKADTIVYVTRSMVTENSYFEFINSSIEDGRLKNVGIVLNGIANSNFGYGNKYGYGYHADKKKWWKIRNS